MLALNRFLLTQITEAATLEASQAAETSTLDAQAVVDHVDQLTSPLQILDEVNLPSELSTADFSLPANLSDS